MFRDPTLNDFLDLIRPKLDDSVEQLRGAIKALENKELSQGQTGNFIRHALDETKEHFEAGALRAFAELKRIAVTTALDQSELRQLTLQSLANYLIAIKAVVEEKLKRVSKNASAAVQVIDRELQALDQKLLLMTRQMDAGLLDLGQGSGSAPTAPHQAGALNTQSLNSTTETAAYQIAANQRKLSPAVLSTLGATEVPGPPDPDGSAPSAATASGAPTSSNGGAATISSGNRHNREDHELGVVVRASLAGPGGAPVARGLCRKLMVAAANHNISGYDYDDLMKGLLNVHPLAILDELFSGDAKSQKESVRLLNKLLRFHKNVLDALPDDIVLTWCDRDPALRCPLAASVVLLFKRPKEGEPHEWLPVAVKLLEKAPDPRLVLNEILHRFHPTSWSGSLATKLEGRLKLLNRLPGGEAPALIEVMTEAKTRLQARIDAERRREQEEDRDRSNRFE